MLVYPDVRGAVAKAAPGLTERLSIGDGHRSQMTFGDGAQIVADTGAGRRAPEPGEATPSLV